MTREEATEIVLGGFAFEPCPQCFGNGRFLVETSTVHSRGTDDTYEVERYLRCRGCNGARCVVSYEFRKACEQLDKPVPKPKQPTARQEVIENYTTGRPTLPPLPTLPRPTALSPLIATGFAFSGKPKVK